MSTSQSPTDTTELPRLPFPRHDVLEIAPLFRWLQARAPINPFRTPAGDVAWLVTGHAQAKTLFADRRLGRSHPDPDRAARISNAALLGGPMGDPTREAEDHVQMRRLLAPAFSARRMNELRPRVTTLVEGLLDDLEAQVAPADLHEALSFPLPVLVICELLGVPYDDRELFRACSAGAAGLTDRAAAASSLAQLVEYTSGLVARKRTAPAQDVISDLIAARGGTLSDDAIAALAAMVLFAGHETTVTRIDVGALLLMGSPDQAEALRRNPSLITSAVEEVLRMAVPSGGGLPRYAQTDIELAGVRIRSGDAVLLAGSIANRDPSAFGDPDRFDITREPNPHLAFGHGPRYCLGAGLARIELEAVFGALVTRFPTLRPAVPVEQLQLRTDLLTGGLAALPVTW